MLTGSISTFFLNAQIVYFQNNEVNFYLGALQEEPDLPRTARDCEKVVLLIQYFLVCQYFIYLFNYYYFVTSGF